MLKIFCLLGLFLFSAYDICAEDGKTAEPPLSNPACIPQVHAGTEGHCAALRNLARQGNIHILFLGDSITNWWAFSENRIDAPGGLEIWDKVYKPLNAANFGVSGDYTQHLLWRITEGRELDGCSPKAIVLLIGANNTHNTNTPAGQIAEGIKRILDTIRQKQPQSKILLLGIFPRGGNAYILLIKEINSMISNYADNQNIFYLDLGEQLLAPDPTMANRVVFRDGLHLTPKGYQIWATAMNPLLFRLAGVKNESRP